LNFLDGFETREDVAPQRLDFGELDERIDRGGSRARVRVEGSRPAEIARRAFKLSSV
jgi:hypothetical protein